LYHKLIINLNFKKMSRNTPKNREEELLTLFGPSKTEVPTESLTYI